jgi:hypothetical protein
MKIFAFWRYDLFPHYLGGTVTEMTPGGAVETKEFEPSRYFRPVKILPVTEGLVLKGKLEALRNEYAQELKKLENKYKAEVDKLMELEG